MTSTPHKQAITAAHVGCAAAAGYAAVKTAWGLGSTVGVRDTAVLEDFMAQIGGPLIAVWATVFLALLASAILQSLVQPWGRRVPRRLSASLAWLGFAIMTPVGLLGLAGTVAKAVAGQPDPMLIPAVYIGVYTCFVVLGLSFAFTAWRTRQLAAAGTSRANFHLVPHPSIGDPMITPATTAATIDAMTTATKEKAAGRAKLRAARAFRIGGRANLVIAAGHVVGLIWAWSVFRAVGIEHEMREFAAQGAVLPYIVTLVVAAAFVVFGFYGLSGAGDVRRLPLLRTGLAAIASIFILRGTLLGGIGAVYEGDGAQIAFAATSLLVGLCYAYGAVTRRGAR